MYHFIFNKTPVYFFFRKKYIDCLYMLFLIFLHYVTLHFYNIRTYTYVTKMVICKNFNDFDKISRGGALRQYEHHP